LGNLKSRRPEGDLKIQSDGYMGLTRGRSIRFRIAYHAWCAGQEQDPTVATALVLTGFSMPPTFEFNGAVRTDLVTRVIHGDRAYREFGRFAFRRWALLPASDDILMSRVDDYCQFKRQM
jgi:hypothetical protein